MGAGLHAKRDAGPPEREGACAERRPHKVIPLADPDSLYSPEKGTEMGHDINGSLPKTFDNRNIKNAT
jgi:hypothetical protein